MAKITKYTKDTVGQQMLSIAAVVLIFWCTMAGLNVSHPVEKEQQSPAIEQTENGNWAEAIWYYMGVPVVSILWGLANFDRTPKAYSSRRIAAIFSLLTGMSMAFTVWVLVFAVRNPEVLSDFLLGT